MLKLGGVAALWTKSTPRQSHRSVEVQSTSDAHSVEESRRRSPGRHRKDMLKEYIFSAFKGFKQLFHAYMALMHLRASGIVGSTRGEGNC
eukprot:432230-Rhodomonas_salina.2